MLVMLRTILGCIGVVLVGAGCLSAAGLQSAPPVHHASQYRALLDRYCVVCHNEQLRTGGLVLSKMDVANISAGAPVWEKVVVKLRTGAMPPVGMPRPDKTDYDSFAAYLERELDGMAAVKPNPGRPVVRRLNRAEYTNAVRDLLAIDIDSESLLPADETGGDFDNIGDVLSVSPMLLERYLSAAGKITRLAIGYPMLSPGSWTYSIPQLLNQEGRISEALPFGSRGGIAIRHRFPLDGEYVIRIYLQRESNEEFIRGLAEPHQLDVRLDGARIKQFTVGGEHKGRSGSETALGDPEQVEYQRSGDSGLEVRFPVKAGTRLVGVAFVKETSETEGVIPPHIEGFGPEQRRTHYTEGDPAVGSVTITGPYLAKGPGDTPSRRQIFVCRPTANSELNAGPVSPELGQAAAATEDACARKILSTLAHRAYRRPVTDGDVRTLLNFYQAGRDNGDFESGIGMAIQRMLVSPEFLFRIERDPLNVAPNSVYPISNLELASRLSFFLWSSIPDDQLLELAEQGKLQDPAILEQQVRRMLEDARSQALVTNFAGQWLYLRNMRLLSPDPDIFPEFDENLRDAFQRETELFFESIVREDRSILDLLNADYTFLNERLARHYGIPNVYGNHFRRVALKDGERRGLLGQGSILTVTSYATRTSPTLRGKWVLDNILGSPPPPPPPNVVTALNDRGGDGKILSVRQQLEQHRTNPSCSGCHARMDPLGFALENFDAIGKWRTIEANTPIDASGVFPDGSKFQGSVELRKILLSHSREFVNAATDKLLTYALGRGLEYSDAPAVRKIVREASFNNYRWSALVMGIVNSTPFQMRRSQEP